MNNFAVSACFAVIAQAFMQCASIAASVMPIFQNDTAANTLSFNDTFGHNVLVGSYNPATGAWMAPVGSVSIGYTFTGGLISCVGSPVTGSGTIGCTIAGTPGGVPYFASGSTWASSGVLQTNQIVLGGGTGGPSTPVGLGTTTQVLHGNAAGAPSFGPITSADLLAVLGSPPAIGGGTPGAGSFSTLSASGTVSGSGFNGFLSSPPQIGSVAPNAGSFTTLSASGIASLENSLLGSQGALNPFAGPYPAFLYGIGGTGFYNGANTLATNAFYNPNGNLTIANQYPYGMLSTAVAGSFTTGSNRGPCVNGFTAPSQVGFFGIENGAVAHCSAADSQPLMTSAAGTFTATTFTPTTPIAQSASVFAAVGMWVRSSDVPAFNGQITSFTVNGSNQITLITVSNWYQEGQGGVAGTPAGSTLYMNPQDKIWASLGATYLNRFQVTGTVSSGSNVITAVSDTSQVYPGGQFLQTATNLFPSKTWVVSKTANTITVNANATGNLVGETLNISTGTSMEHSVSREIDLFHIGTASISPSYVSGAGATTNGTFDITGVTNVASLYPNMSLRSNVNLGQEVTILSVNIGASSIKVSQKATGTGAITYQAYSRFDEGGAGEDCATLGQPGNTCFNQRGQVDTGYRSSGAGTASFMVQPDSMTGNANLNGFLVDQTLGVNVNPFNLTNTNKTVSLWHIDQFGNDFAQGLVLNPVTIANLQTCNAGVKGLVRYVSDTVASGAAVWHGAVVGGGATTVNSFALCTGAAWQYE
jgi:hypothetical protein